MSREIERERESTRPERENPTLSVPAFRRAGVARSPHACDPTAGGRDGMATSCLVHSMYPPAVQGGLAPSSAQCAPADDRPHARERSCGLAQDHSDGEGREWPSPSDQSTAKPHMAWPVEVKHPQCAPGLAGDVGESSPCPGDDYSHPRGLARGEDSEAVTAWQGLARQVPVGGPGYDIISTQLFRFEPGVAKAPALRL